MYKIPRIKSASALQELISGYRKSKNPEEPVFYLQNKCVNIIIPLITKPHKKNT